MTDEVLKQSLEQKVLEAIRARLDELQRAKRIPLIVRKEEIPEVVGLPFREVRPALVALVNSGQIRFGRTISSQYFTLPDL
jgi:hypothetical protein